MLRYTNESDLRGLTDIYYGTLKRKDNPIKKEVVKGEDGLKGRETSCTDTFSIKRKVTSFDRECLGSLN